MKELKEFQAMGISKADILNEMGWIMSIDIDYDECPEKAELYSYFMLSYRNELTDKALSVARSILYRMNSDMRATTRKVKALRKRNLHKCAQALVDAGILEENPVAYRGVRRRRK